MAKVFCCQENQIQEKYDFSGRELPIYANYPYQISDSVVINYEFNIVPDSVELFSGDVNNFGFVSFEYNISKEGNKIYFNYDKKYNSRIIYSEQFDEYKKFCEKLREASSQNIKFHVSF